MPMHICCQDVCSLVWKLAVVESYDLDYAMCPSLSCAKEISGRDFAVRTAVMLCDAYARMRQLESFLQSLCTTANNASHPGNSWCS